MENPKRIEFGEFNSAGLLTASVNVIKGVI